MSRLARRLPFAAAIPLACLVNAAVVGSRQRPRQVVLRL